jgi:hypothetical protein
MTAKFDKKKKRRFILIASGVICLLILAFVLTAVLRTSGRTVMQFDIHQNKEIIHLSTFAEPPQFAIWLENPENNHCQTVFVTRRVSIGDWEGKANVPDALPRWYEIFQEKGDIDKKQNLKKDPNLAVTGATPRDDYFSVRVDVKPGSQWICWVEMNLAGDFNDAYPEFNESTFQEDEFSCGQPSLLFKAEITAIEGMVIEPELVAQSVWEKGTTSIEPVSDGVTTARDVFEEIKISVMKPKVRLIEEKINYP